VVRWWRRSEGEWFQKSFLMVGCVGVECEVLVVVFCVEGSELFLSGGLSMLSCSMLGDDDDDDDDDNDEIGGNDGNDGFLFRLFIKLSFPKVVFGLWVV